MKMLSSLRRWTRATADRTTAPSNSYEADEAEIEKIMESGPVGTWASLPQTFSLMEDRVVFHADGSGVWTSASAMSGTHEEPFAWTMTGWGRLLIASQLGDDGTIIDLDAADQAPAGPPTIELERRETESGSAVALRSVGRDGFWLLESPIVRVN